jgi:hypothetical protein
MERATTLCFAPRTTRQMGDPVYMNVQEQIKKYIANQPEPKRSNMRFDQFQPTSNTTYF